MNIADTAVRYAERGLPVFPVRGKLPLTEHGFKDASTDADTIRGWFEQWPDANVAIPTGPASGLVVLDVDPRHGGDQSLAALEERYGVVPATLEARTGGGGRHLFFALGDGQNIRNSAGKLGSGLDVRGDGGYIVAPPSIHPETKQPYVWTNRIRPVLAPAWLIQALSAPSPVSESISGAPIPAGRRNDALMRIAGAMRRKGCTPEAIEAALLAENARRCNPPLTEPEVRAIAQSVSRYAPALSEEVAAKFRSAQSTPPAIPQRNAAPTEDGAGLLRDLRSFVQRYVVLSSAQASALALWITHTHTISAFDVTPYLNINSAEKQSGKTRLLEILKVTVANPWMTGRVTAAVLVRKVDAEHPTLLLDESDAAFNGEKEYAEALRGILNTGYLGDGQASLCVGSGAKITFKDFSTFCPKAIAGIGQLPDTVQDRSIPIRLRRAAPGEVVARFRRRNVKSEVTPLRERIESWSSVVIDSLVLARPSLPDCLTDRQQDVVEPLLAIADAAGGEWPEESRAALMEIFGAARDDSSIGVRLLADIRAVLDGDEDFPQRDRITSADLAEALGKIETSPWGEWSKGKLLTPAKLARLLSNFGITPTTKRIAGSPNQRGYERADFEDSWTRYLPRPDLQNATTPHPNVYGPSSDFSNRHAKTDVAVQEREIANNNGPCGVVALSSLPKGENEENVLEGEM